eukprot:m.85312 g.85312  ORF g.85312 m.85312 type:complete len:216 (+) comp50870_c0_seq2:193-840(+)
MFTQEDVKQLLSAVEGGSLAACQQIVSLCGKHIITALFAWRTALHCAVSNNRLQILQWFLSLSINLNVLSRAGRTALMDAACENSTACAKELLAYGADTRIRNPHGTTALDYAKLYHRAEIVAAIEEHDRLLRNVKPAARESMRPALQLEEAGDQEGVQAINLLTLAEHYFPSEEVSEDPKSVQAEIAAVPSSGQSRALSMPTMSLGDLDFEFPE